MNKSCETCIRGPERSISSQYCYQCGDDLVFFVAGSFDEERIDTIGQNGNTAEHYAHVMSAPPAIDNTASGFLLRADQIMTERGKQYDQEGGERSMGKTVQAFNAITGRDLSEADGWAFMTILKQVRLFTNTAQVSIDSCDDLIAYSALLGECAATRGVK